MNFDYLRLFLAVTVMSGHLIFPALQFMPFWHNELAVLFFFCISGFLITQSFMRDGDILRYARNRVARIYPPIVVTVVALVVFGLATGEGQAFIRGAFALLLLQDWYPLHQAGEPLYTHGAFWTIIIEVQFYVTLPLALILLRKRPALTLVLFLAVLIGAHYARRYMYVDGYPPQLMAFRDNLFTVAHFFIAGMLAAIYAPKITEHRHFWWLFVVSALLFFGMQKHGNEIATHFQPFFIAVIVLGVAKASFVLSKRLGMKDPKRAPWGDISYGVYIYHFPVMTILALYGITDGRLGVALTVSAAFVSWHLVEKRLLRRAKNGLRAPEVLPHADASPAR